MKDAKQMGWCWGPENVLGYEKHWIQCSEDISSRQLVENVGMQPPPTAEPKRNVWFVPDDNFTSCFESRTGPADRIEDSKGLHPSVIEKNGGRVVQVKADYDRSRYVIWTYYRDKVECERVETNVEKKLADKYR